MLKLVILNSQLHLVRNSKELRVWNSFFILLLERTCLMTLTNSPCAVYLYLGNESGQQYTSISRQSKLLLSTSQIVLHALFPAQYCSLACGPHYDQLQEA